MQKLERLNIWTNVKSWAMSAALSTILPVEGISDEEIQAMCAACFAHDAKSRPSMALVLSFWQGCHSFN